MIFGIRRRASLAGALLLVLLVALPLGVGLAQEPDTAVAAPLGGPRLGATLVVTSIADSGAGSLRQAIADAADGDTVTFDATVFATPQTITLTTGELVVDKAVTIFGPGADKLAISGNNASRVISMSDGISVTLADLTIREGYVLDTNGAGIYLGAGSALTLTHTALISNTAERASMGGVGGGLYAEDGTVAITDCSLSDNVARIGGGLHLEHGSLDMVRTQVERNAATFQGSGAGLSGGPSTNVRVSGGRIGENSGAGIGLHSSDQGATNLRLTDVLFEQNASPSSGGAVFVAGWPGEVVVESCTFAENTSSAWGGAMSIRTQSLSIADSLFEGNQASRAGALVAWEATTTNVTNTRFVSNTATLSGGAATFMAPAMLDRCLFQGNVAGESGGALTTHSGDLALTITNSEFFGNTAAEAGGGLWASGSTWITDSLFVGNLVTDTRSMGGGLFLEGVGGIASSRFEANHSFGMGGGIVLSGGAPGSTSVALRGPAQLSGLTILNTAIVSNTSEYGGAGLLSDGGSVVMLDSTVAGNIADGGDGWGTGGGVQLMDVPVASFTNTTIANNHAVGADDDGGGGMMIYDFANANSQVHLLHCTLTGNSTTSTSASGTGGGGISAVGTYTLHMTNTLVAGNVSAAGKPDVAATVTSGGGNLVGNGAGANGLTHGVNGDQVGTAANPIGPLLGDLGDYGGATGTVPLLPGSPAIDKATGVSAILKDQRGVARPQGAASDIGAYEARPFTLSVAGGNIQSTRVNTPFDMPLVVTVTGVLSDPVAGGQVTYAAPTSGASAMLTPTVATIGADGTAASTATANGIEGSYEVAASTAGATIGVKFDLTNTPEQLPVAVTVSLNRWPERLCPGYNLYYTIVISNASEAAGLTNVVMTTALPVGTWYAPGDATGAYPGGSANGQYSESGALRQITWTIPTLAAGQAANLGLTLHTYTTLAHGTVLTQPFGSSVDQLPSINPVFDVVSTIDTAGCTPPPPPPVDLTLGGYITSRPTGAPIAGATVTATTCLPGAWVATADAEGFYHLTLPGDVLAACETVTLTVSAPGHRGAAGTYAVAALRANPARDFALDAFYTLWLPLMFDPVGES